MTIKYDARCVRFLLLLRTIEMHVFDGKRTVYSFPVRVNQIIVARARRYSKLFLNI